MIYIYVFIYKYMYYMSTWTLGGRKEKFKGHGCVHESRKVDR